MTTSSRRGRGEWGGEPFDPRKWQAYVRRVAKKMRTLDQHAARRAA